MNGNIPESENKKNKKFNIMEVLKNRKKRSAVTLGLYFIFFVVIFIYIGSINSNVSIDNQNTNNNTNINTNTEDTYNYGQIKYSYYTPLMNNNYKYKVNYYINTEEKKYEGERKNNSYSVVPEENYILGIEDILNIDSILALIKKSQLSYETKYSSGVMLQAYDVPINDFCAEYNINLDNSDSNVEMRIYANPNYVDKVYFDITNLASLIDKNITKYEIEAYFSNLGSIE